MKFKPIKTHAQFMEFKRELQERLGPFDPKIAAAVHPNTNMVAVPVSVFDGVGVTFTLDMRNGQVSAVVRHMFIDHVDADIGFELFEYTDVENSERRHPRERQETYLRRVSGVDLGRDPQAAADVLVEFLCEPGTRKLRRKYAYSAKKVRTSLAAALGAHKLKQALKLMGVDADNIGYERMSRFDFAGVMVELDRHCQWTDGVGAYNISFKQVHPDKILGLLGAAAEYLNSQGGE